MGIERFEDIRAWQSARALVKGVYETVAKSECRFDLELRRQLTSAALSVMSNIAEGFGRGTDADFIRFLDIARASASEVQSLLYVCVDTRAMTDDQVGSLRSMATESVALTAALQRYLRGAKRKQQR